MLTNIPNKRPLSYICELCNFYCSNKKDYNRHLSTRKHKMFTHVDVNVDDKTPKTPYKVPTFRNPTRKTIKIKELVLSPNGSF